MTLTGPQEFGDPCRECGYRWTGSPRGLDEAHGRVHAALDEITVAEFETTASTSSWSVGQYICHIGDNEHVWAERFAAAEAGDLIRIAPFDQDRLATARNYHLVGHASGMWSLRRAYDDVTRTSRAALRRAATFDHPERGEMSALDAIRMVVHDCHHHWWDIRRILTHAGSAGRWSSPVDVGSQDVQ